MIIPIRDGASIEFGIMIDGRVLLRTLTLARAQEILRDLFGIVN